MKNRKQEKGITLIALVVTIIILIILAGVSIALVLGDNGIVNRSKLAKKEYINAASDEEQQLEGALNEMEMVVGSNRDTTIKNNYRTDGTETESNEYFDGKKIYRKYITKTLNASSGWLDEEHHIENVDKIWINISKSYAEEEGFWNVIPFAGAGVTYRVNATKIGTWPMVEYWKGKTVVLLLEYTKTTDTPISM